MKNINTGRVACSGLADGRSILCTAVSSGRKKIAFRAGPRALFYCARLDLLVADQISHVSHGVEDNWNGFDSAD